MSATLILGLTLLCSPPAFQDERQDESHPLMKDKTGMAWVLPFTRAKAKAAAEKRLLLIKPVAFGTSKEGAGDPPRKC